MRILVVVLVLCALSGAAVARTVGPASDGGACRWTEPGAPPKLEVVDGAVRFTWPLAVEWFACARAKGGEMNVSFVTRDLRDKVARGEAFTRTTAHATESVPLESLCGASVAREIRVQVVGTGPMDRLLLETPWVAVPCFSCDQPAESALTLEMNDPDSPAGFVTVKGRYDDAFRTCATKASQAALSLRVFVGQSQLEARTRLDHSFVLLGLQRTATFRKAFAPTNLCLDGKSIGVELFGTGEFRQLNGGRRAALRLDCPEVP